MVLKRHRINTSSAPTAQSKYSPYITVVFQASTDSVKEISEFDNVVQFDNRCQFQQRSVCAKCFPDIVKQLTINIK